MSDFWRDARGVEERRPERAPQEVPDATWAPDEIPKALVEVDDSPGVVEFRKRRRSGLTILKGRQVERQNRGLAGRRAHALVESLTGLFAEKPPADHLADERRQVEP